MQIATFALSTQTLECNICVTRHSTSCLCDNTITAIMQLLNIHFSTITCNFAITKLISFEHTNIRMQYMCYTTVRHACVKTQLLNAQFCNNAIIKYTFCNHNMQLCNNTINKHTILPSTLRNAMCIYNAIKTKSSSISWGHISHCQAAMEKLHSNQLLTAKEERGGDTIQTASLISSFEPTLSQLTAKWLPTDYLRGNHRNLIPLKVDTTQGKEFYNREFNYQLLDVVGHKELKGHT